MASLADGWIEQRQMCVNVLCAYLRMENEGGLSELRVREAISSIIRERTQPESAQSWSDLNFDISGAFLSDLDFSGCLFAGTLVNFSRAHFSGILTSFEGASFKSERTIFSECIFDAKTTRLNYCSIFSREIWFERVEFTGRAWLDYLSTSGEIISFSGSKITGDRFSLAGASFSSKEIVFDGVEFAGERASFSRCSFSGITSFRGSVFGGSEIWFDRVQLLGPSADFEEVQLNCIIGLSGVKVDHGCSLSSGPLEFPTQ
ncbi:pentapeptide repeat-containing protein [Umezawaea sp. Da 62-37]|uniref:pentapeptide repeat-containing protein n=1 Tax=Umezawaea sp. Da 62-37 TaxID=3075927 RepID=UPI0028F6D9A4|nr:pentapeptide repeat-containing protein [Umezawaea sp. Da 62-37]WNV82892.1 pentapeptide repeat-containing protein [Umezawaea sp. Da 62-37]